MGSVNAAACKIFNSFDNGRGEGSNELRRLSGSAAFFPAASTMKLSVKTLTNEQFVVEVSDAGTVADVKTAIQASGLLSLRANGWKRGTAERSYSCSGRPCSCILADC